ncbi:MAG: ABC transporter ATP-binding protein/permease [Clostridia bacterium]|nr:ABC transporter ATP-binding protein/permease [Clostridia bacterium]MBQ7407573.1 ABC transporter ATP-binding protein/permease [Clostridia bacterium]
MIRIKGLHKFYSKGRPSEIHVLNDITLDLPEKGMVAVFGKSGCGKTTLLNTVGGLDTFESGTLTVDGKSILRDTDALRNAYIGYIFQNYNLNKTDTCFDNVAAALRLCGMEDESEIRTRVMAALENVGMEKYALRLPDTLSGGQQQRIAIARAIVKNPRIILADEPTGNLDEANTVMIMDLLREIARDHLVLLVTHEENLVDFYCDRVIEISDGRVLGERENAAVSGYTARDKNAIYLGELSHSEIESENTEIDYYGEAADKKIKLTLVNHAGKLYLKVGTPGVQILDETSETHLCEGVYKEDPRKDESRKKIDMSKLPPVQGTRFGRLFSLRSAIRSGYFASFKAKKAKGITLRACMALFAAAIVFMSAFFGTAFSDLRNAKNAYNHNVFYVYTKDGKTSEILNGAVGSAESGIDYIRLMRYFPDGDDTFYFRTGSFETFKQFEYDFSERLKANAVLLSAALTKNMNLLAGKREGLADEEILITSRVADTLLEASTLGYITEYKDLLGLVCDGYAVGDKSLRIAGVVRSSESAIYLSEIAAAKYVKENMLFSRYYALASDYKMTIPQGEAILMIKSRTDGVPIPALGDTVKLFGGDVKVTKIYEQGDYDAYLSKRNITKQTEEEYFGGLVLAENPGLSPESDAYKSAYKAKKNEHYFEYCDYYYEYIEEYLLELYFFRSDTFSLWLLAEKGIEEAKYAYTDYFYFKALQYKEQNGAYPKYDEAGELCKDLPDAHDFLLDYETLYSQEFYESDLYSGLHSTTYLLNEADYIALSARDGETHPSTTFVGPGVIYGEDEYGDPDFIDYDSVIYTVIHSSDPAKTERWLKTALTDLKDPTKHDAAILTPDAVFDELIREQMTDIVTSLVTLTVLLALMSLCMYFIMRSSLMSRIREIGILRAIGVSKKNLVFKFFIEAAVLTVLTVFIGFLVTSGFIFACFGISSFTAQILYYPVWLAIADLSLLFAISLFFGTLPVLSLLKKTPSEILSKYDI